MALETWFAMLPKLVVSDGAICSGRYLLGGQAVNMVTDPAGIAEDTDVVMKVVFGIFSLGFWLS